MPYADVNNTTLYYEDSAGPGRPLLFLHGRAASGRVWDAQLPEFTRDHRVVTVDWRGCGRSARPADGHTLDNVVADFVALIGALGLDRPVVVGSSIGGTFATELAARHPGLVAGAVSVDGPAHWPTQGMPLDELGERLRRDLPGTLAEWVPRWFAPGVSPETVDSTIRHLLDAGPFLDENLELSAVYDPRPLLPRLTVPLHYVHGELDTEIPVHVARTCADLTPGAELRVIAGAGHMPHQERPAEFNAALRATLARMFPAEYPDAA